MIAIVGGVIGGLVFLVVVGIGALIFLRRQKVSGGEIDHRGGTFKSEHAMPPPQMQLYVSCSILSPNSFSDRR